MNANDVAVSTNVHQRIHEGVHFTVLNSGTVASGSNLDILFVTPAQGYEVHLIVDGFSTGACEFFLYETPTTSAAGSAATAYNNNRNSSNTANSTVTTGPTVTGVGTLIDQTSSGGGPGGTLGGDAAGRMEWELAKGGTYLIRATSRAASNLVKINAKFYEEKD